MLRIIIIINFCNELFSHEHREKDIVSKGSVFMAGPVTLRLSCWASVAALYFTIYSLQSTVLFRFLVSLLAHWYSVYVDTRQRHHREKEKQIKAMRRFSRSFRHRLYLRKLEHVKVKVYLLVKNYGIVRLFQEGSNRWCLYGGFVFVFVFKQYTFQDELHTYWFP